MTNFKAVKREKARFNQLLVILKRSKSVELKTNALGLVNAVVNVPSDIDQRMHYRNEFIRLGLKRILKVTLPTVRLALPVVMQRWHVIWGHSPLTNF
jgi:hypothetical protein